MVNLYGKGFIGKHYAEKYDVVCNDRNDLIPKSNNILYMISTVDNYNVLTNPYIDIETNLIHLMRILEQCKGKDITFNFISSWFVYGDVNISPVKEDYNCKPKGFYSITKHTAEQLLISYCETFGIKYRILRLSNVVGSIDKKSSNKKNVLQFLINEIKNDKDVYLSDGGNFIRDYMHVSDVCDAIHCVITKGDINTIYNVGTGKPILFKDVINYVKTRISSKSKIIDKPCSSFDKLTNITSIWMDCKKLENLGFKPKYDIYKILDELIGV